MFVQAILRAAQIRADEPATICENRVRRWRESADRTARLAAALSALGARDGDRIAILGVNSDHYLEAMHATWWLGGVTVPMNTRWAIAEHLYSARDAGFSIVFVDEANRACADELAHAEPALGPFIYMGEGGAPAGMLSMEALIAEAGPLPPAPRPNEAVTGIYYTGGTTGHPKGVMHSSLSLWAGATTIAMEMQGPRHHRYLHAAPMFHLGDLAQAYATTAKAGCHVFVPGFTADGVARAIRDHKVEVTLLVPTMIGMLLDSPGFDPADFGSLEVLLFGGSPISDTVLGRMRSALPGVRLIQGFGQTETMATGSMLPDDGKSLAVADPRRQSAGRAAYGIQLGIFDEAGQPVPDGTTGEIWIRGASAMLGYWNKPEESAAALTDGWVHSGDAGYLDEGGYLFVCDRVKDMVISGGENVFSAEVENAIASHPDVAQVAVIGVPDERWGERVHAIIVPASGTAPGLDDIQQHCRALIAGYKIPRSVELRGDPLPLSAVGKVLKTKLREPHWQGRARRVS
ncbi:MAG TPA: AMP-binding protein [Sphingopyxis sp.]|uniref:class I adenylate-forming enzyme family protein n=1 Tax=Sphingopyxis sp. TaxID=1908224 RepID=UPI002E37915C|nr:AMP-binding protein [Sphingopyxis sp.]HEX2814580.1 AMP-binding protein [Sphingopyxis sp.]